MRRRLEQPPNERTSASRVAGSGCRIRSHVGRAGPPRAACGGATDTVLAAAGGVAPVTIRLPLADDQALVRGALATLLDLEPDMTVVAEVGRGDEVESRRRCWCGDARAVTWRPRIAQPRSLCRARSSCRPTGFPKPSMGAIIRLSPKASTPRRESTSISGPAGPGQAQNWTFHRGPKHVSTVSQNYARSGSAAKSKSLGRLRATRSKIGSKQSSHAETLANPKLPAIK